MDALSRLSRFEVRLGKLEFRGTRASDSKQRVDRVAILTGDSEFIPALKVAKNEGVLVHLYHGDPSSVHREVWMEADERTRGQAAINRLLMR